MFSTRRLFSSIAVSRGPSLVPEIVRSAGGDRSTQRVSTLYKREEQIQKEDQSKRTLCDPVLSANVQQLPYLTDSEQFEEKCVGFDRLADKIQSIYGTRSTTKSNP